MNRTILFSAVAVVAAGLAWSVGCASTTCVANCSGPDGGGVDSGGIDVSVTFPDGGGDAGAPFGVGPLGEQDVTVTCGQAPSPVTFTATALDGKTPLSVSWSTDQASIGTVSPQTGTSTTFTPTGTTGGIVNVIATYDGVLVATPVFVSLTCSENGGCPASQIATSTTQLTQGGGVGGVGGEGCGVAVDPATASVLASPTNSGMAQGLKFLYPYARTVFPRGVLAPSLQWDWSIGDADAIRIDLSTTSGSFTWHGTFTRPAILSQTSGKFIRHPIPEDVWETAINTAGTSIHGKRDDLTINITLASGGQGYGPLPETVTIAPGTMKGTIHYEAYGTHYVSSPCWGTGIGVLAIKHGATSPVLVSNANNCQGCHSVAAQGSTMVLQNSCYSSYVQYDFNYDLTKMQPDAGALQPNGAPPTHGAVPDTGIGIMPTPIDQYTWGAISPDGTLLFSNSAPKFGSPGYGMDGAVQTPSVLFSLPLGGSLVSSASIQTELALPTQLSATMPVFSPDSQHLAFNLWQGDNKVGDGFSVAAVDFDPKSNHFSNLRVVDTPPTNTGCSPSSPASCYTDVWPSFLPTSDGVVFERQLASDGCELGGDVSSAHYGNACGTGNSEGELWWVDLATKTAHRLDTLNGDTGYLPVASNHPNDTVLGYHPTVAPIASGGYVWVIFMSRRLYGNIATIDPFDSDVQTNGAWKTQPMTKKLWVAAIDLNAPPGTDPSHPAFYLPAQELMAGNLRSFWVLDPCEKTGTSCESGDECCSGHCVSATDGGAPSCGESTSCGGEGDTCGGGATCCPNLQCVGGHCDVIPVN